MTTKCYLKFIFRVFTLSRFRDKKNLRDKDPPGRSLNKRHEKNRYYAKYSGWFIFTGGDNRCAAAGHCVQRYNETICSAEGESAFAGAAAGQRLGIGLV